MTLINSAQLDTSPVELLAGFVPRTGIGILWGPSTAGKSLIALDLAYCVNSGRDWLGQPVNHPGAVAYGLGEGVSDFGLRLRAREARQAADDARAVATVARDHGDAAARALAAALPPCDSSRIYVQTESFVMHFDRADKPSPSMRQAVAQLAALPDLELVVIDALDDFSGQLSICNHSSASRIIKGMKWLASELDVFVLAVAHATADGSKMMGAGRLFNACDLVAEVVPDQVGAPGALATSTITVRKNKSSGLADPIGVTVEPCQWQQAAEDENGNEIPGEMITVKSATVRVIEQASPDRAPEPQRQAPPLPVLQEVPRRSKRNGIKRDHGGLHSVPDLPAAPGAAPLAALADAADVRRALVAGCLAVPCPACDRPASCGCDGKMEPRPLVLGRTLSGPLYAHEDRVLSAALAGAVDLDQVLAAVS